MRRSGNLTATGILILLATQMLAPTDARARVPRSCVHPWADAILCPQDTRRVLLKVIPSARRRALWLQRPRFEWTIGIHEWERNELLRQIRDDVRERALRD